MRVRYWILRLVWREQSFVFDLLSFLLSKDIAQSAVADEYDRFTQQWNAGKRPQWREPGEWKQ